MKKRKRMSAFLIDQDLHVKFKMFCVKNNRTMVDVLSEVISEYIRKHISV